MKKYRVEGYCRDGEVAEEYMPSQALVPLGTGSLTKIERKLAFFSCPKCDLQVQEVKEIQV
jgi:hypothetical protein